MQDHRPKIQSADYYQGKSKVKSFKTAAVFAKRTEPMGEALKKLLSILKAQNVDYLLETSTAEHLPGSTGVSLEELGEKEVSGFMYDYQYGKCKYDLQYLYQYDHLSLGFDVMVSARPRPFLFFHGRWRVPRRLLQKRRPDQDLR